ncbi:MAG TPA: hypothetical protein VM221_10220 [Armatimonadota bacterium]|nr:hypothetical protein [Armatimonadota bacterium]
MDVEDIVVGIIDASGGELHGRTYLQKVTYFAAKRLGVQAGFEAHYYGPYSRRVSAEADSLVSRGILSEVREDFGAHGSPGDEQVRYTYQLTPEDGKRYLEFLRAIPGSVGPELAQCVNQIRSTGADYRQLSCAAKIDHILTAAGGRITRKRAKEEAQKLGWRLSDSDIETAVTILAKLGLIKRR